MDSEHARGVLRRERSDRRGAVDAERGKRLEVGLDAGAAAGIRAGDGQGDCGHHVPFFASMASTTSRRPRAASAGSGASESAEMTATPSAPAAITAPALLASMPAMPRSGSAGARRRSTRGDFGKAHRADRRAVLRLGERRIDAADAGVIDQFDWDRLRGRDSLDRDADNGTRRKKLARILDRHVVRPEMHAVGTRRQRDIDAVVDDERHVEWRQRRLDRPRGGDHRPRVVLLVAQLHQGGAARGDAPGEIGEVAAAGALGIDDGVEADVDGFHGHASFSRARRVARSRLYTASMIASAKLPGPSAFCAAISPAMANAASAAVVAMKASLSTASAAPTSAERGAARGRHQRHERMTVADREAARAVGHEVGRAGDRSDDTVRLGKARRRVADGLVAGQRGEFPMIEPHRHRPTFDQLAGEVRPRRRHVDEHRIEHPGHARRGGRAERGVDRAPPLGVERAEIDQERVGAGDEGDHLLRGDRHRRHRAGGEQHARGIMLRDIIGDAMHPRRAVANPRQNIGDDIGKLDGRVHCSPSRLYPRRRACGPEFLRPVALSAENR